MCHAVASRLAAGWLGHRADRKHGLDRVLGLRGGEGGITLRAAVLAAWRC